MMRRLRLPEILGERGLMSFRKIPNWCQKIPMGVKIEKEKL